MASIKDLKKRIGSVKNTQQTTKAMKMVSAAKLRRAQDAIQAQRPYAKGVDRLLHLVAHLPESKNSGIPVLQDVEIPRSERKLLLVVVSSDRGLCGGFNSYVIRTAARAVAEERKKVAEVHLAFVGKKAYEFFRTKDYKLGPYFGEMGARVTFLKARQVTDRLVQLFESGEFHEIKFVYNEFKNAVTQHPVVEDYLPMTVRETEALTQASDSFEPMLLIKPNSRELLEELVKKNFVVQVHRVLLESQAGEHGARMSAMENATKNAGEMIKKLALQYNKQRQAGITKELLEIISGSESQKSA